MNTQNVITEIRSHPTAQFTVKTHTLREKKKDRKEHPTYYRP